MIKKLFLACSFLLIGSFAHGSGISSRLNIRSADGLVSNWPYQLKVSSNTLTDNADGTMTLSVSAVSLSSTQTWTGGNTFSSPSGVSVSSNVTAGGFVSGTGAIPPGSVNFSTSSKSSVNVNLPTSGQYGDFGSLVLSSGNWSCYYQGRLNDSNGTTETLFEIAISTSSGNNGANFSNGDNYMAQTFPALASNQNIESVIGSYDFNLTAQTTYYAKMSATYGGGQPVMTGRFTCKSQ